MNGSRLIEIWNSLSAKEIRALGKLIQSPFHNKRKDVKLLFDFIKKEMAKPDPNLDKSTIHQVIFPKQPYNDNAIRYAMSFLLQQIEQFLLITHFQENHTSSRLILSNIYRSRNLEKAFVANQKKIHNALNKEEQEGLLFQQNQYHFLLENTLFESERKRASTIDFQALANQQHIAFLIEKLRRSCTILSHQNIIQEAYDIPLIQPILKEIQEKDLTKIPGIGLYYYAFLALSKPEEENYFSRLQFYIKNFGDHFPKSEIRDVYILAINYCIRKSNMGQSQIIQELFQLYQLGLTQEVFLENGFLSPYTYKNIAVAGLLLNEFAWVKQFNLDYKAFLKTEFQESSFSYNMAKLTYRQKDYDAVLGYLQKVEFNDLFLNLDSRTILLKIYLERQEDDALSASLNSFQRFLKRNKVVGYHKENYLNVIRSIRDISRLNPYDKVARDQLIVKIKNTTPLTEKTWLLQQIKGQKTN